MYLAAGTQAASQRDNCIALLKLTGISQGGHGGPAKPGKAGEDDESDDESDDASSAR